MVIKTRAAYRLVPTVCVNYQSFYTIHCSNKKIFHSLIFIALSNHNHFQQWKHVTVVDMLILSWMEVSIVRNVGWLRPHYITSSRWVCIDNNLRSLAQFVGGTGQSAFIIEESVVDSSAKTFTTYTRNINFAKLLSVEEKCIYFSCPNNSTWWVVTTHYTPSFTCAHTYPHPHSHAHTQHTKDLLSEASVDKKWHNGCLKSCRKIWHWKIQEKCQKSEIHTTQCTPTHHTHTHTQAEAGLVSVIERLFFVPKFATPTKPSL